MKARRRQSKENSPTVDDGRLRHEAATTDGRLAERLRPWCLAAAAALFVARPLWPSDSATIDGAGLPAALLWLLLLAVWLVAGVRDGQLPVRWRGLDAVVVVLVAWFACSGGWAIQHAAPRPAINVVWEWSALATAFWLVRQWIRNPAEARALLVVMIATSVVESAHAFEQYFVTLPADRAAYAADPDTMLRNNGLWFEPGSRERYLFEQRLASTEPFGTFELANSLGGFLAAWLVVAGAAAVIGITRRGQPARDIVLAAVTSGIPIAAALVLTKSRSAILAAGTGLITIAVLALGAPAVRATRARYLVVAGASLMVLASVAFGWLTGALDWEVLSEAPKSLGYRWEYWQGTFPIIRQQPLLGCGPGNFRDAYTVHKLAVSSEEIADPHNFLLEVAASAGLPAVAALLIVLAAVARVVVGFGQPQVAESTPRSSRGAAIILAGGAAGFLLAFSLPRLVGPLIPVAISGERMLVGLVIAALVAAAWWSWIRSGTITPWVPLSGAMALAVNFLAAGGIGFPATAGTLWLLLALALVLADADRPATIVGRRGLMAASLVACALAVVCYATACRPATAAARAAAAAAACREPAEVEAHLLAAASADPLDARPWTQLASFRFSLWVQSRDDAHWSAFQQAADHMLELRPQHSAGWSYVGDCYLEAARLADNPAWVKEAVRAYRRAIELYPRLAVRHAKLAVALAHAGDPMAARSEAEEALRLDAITPHLDQKLPDDLRQVIERLGSSSGDPSAERFR